MTKPTTSQPLFIVVLLSILYTLTLTSTWRNVQDNQSQRKITHHGWMFFSGQVGLQALAETLFSFKMDNFVSNELWLFSRGGLCSLRSLSSLSLLTKTFSHLMTLFPFRGRVRVRTQKAGQLPDVLKSYGDRMRKKQLNRTMKARWRRRDISSTRHSLERPSLY